MMSVSWQVLPGGQGRRFRHHETIEQAAIQGQQTFDDVYCLIKEFIKLTEERGRHSGCDDKRITHHVPR